MFKVIRTKSIAILAPAPTREFMRALVGHAITVQLSLTLLELVLLPGNAVKNLSARRANLIKKIATLALALTPEFTPALAGLAITAQLTLIPLQHQLQQLPEDVVRNPSQPAALMDNLTRKIATLALAKRMEFISAHSELAIMVHSSLTLPKLVLQQ